MQVEFVVSLYSVTKFYGNFFISIVIEKLRSDFHHGLSFIVNFKPILQKKTSEIISVQQYFSLGEISKK